MSWFDEYHTDWQESALECGAVVAVWAVVHYLSWKLIVRLHYLESFLRICSWCKKIECENQWLPVAEFMNQEYKIKTTHGMCPACAAQIKAELDGKDTKKKEAIRFVRGPR